MELIPFSIIFLLAACLSCNGLTVFSAIILMISGIVLFIFYLRKYKTVLNPASLFSMSWIFCIGLACLKLSNLQRIWQIKTWICFYLIYILFILCFKAGEKKSVFKKKAVGSREYSSQTLSTIIYALSGISVVSFVIEALILGYVPLFTTGVPHAYSYFHVSGLHYFTVLFVLVPSFCVLYYMKGNSFKKSIPVDACFIICLILPVLLVSRFQLVFGILLAFFTFLYFQKRKGKLFLSLKLILIVFVSFLCLVCLYILLTVERAHSVEYLNGIFEMKDSSTPIFVTQPYIYIVNNFENFDCLVENLSSYTYGLRQAFPFFALTGLKFIFPELVSFPLYLTKEELTTVTMFYDAYYDFGPAGCILFSSFLGFLYGVLFRITHNVKHDMLTLLYVQLLLYLSLAFFTTWFSNPTTYFYFAICLIIDMIVWLCTRNSKEEKING